MIQQWLNKMRHAPLAVWVVVAMMIGTATYQYPTYRISRTIPGAGSVAPEVVKEKLPLTPYVIGVGLLVLGVAAGMRWAVYFNIATVWIFPLETLLGVKAPLHGATLAALHIVAVLLLLRSRGYFLGANIRREGLS